MKKFPWTSVILGFVLLGALITEVKSQSAGMIAGSTGRLSASGTTPGVSNCGVTPTITGTNSAGKITAGTGVLTSCQVDFTAGFYPSAPVCTASQGSEVAALHISTLDATRLVITGANLTSDILYFVCIQVS